MSDSDNNHGDVSENRESETVRVAKVNADRDIIMHGITWAGVVVLTTLLRDYIFGKNVVVVRKGIDGSTLDISITGAEKALDKLPLSGEPKA